MPSRVTLEQQKRELLRLLQEKERRKKEAPMLFYRPHLKQQRMHDATTTHRVILVIGSNKCGKTYGGVHWGLANSYGYRFWEVPNLRLCDGDLPPREQIPRCYWIHLPSKHPIDVPNAGFVVSGLPRERGIGQVIFPEVRKTLPLSVKQHKRFRLVRGPQGVPTQIHLPNGSSWIFGTADQDELTFEGTRLQWAWIDEPVRPFVFNGIWRGLMIDQGPCLFTLTPLGNDATWIAHKWIENPTQLSSK